MSFHPDVEGFLTEVSALDPPPATGAPAEALRERMRRLCAHFAGTPPEVETETAIGCPVPARRYGKGEKLLVWFHGGRMVTGDLETHDAMCRHLAAASGWPVLAVDYRLAPEHPFPASLDDALAATAWAMEQAGCVVVGGDSAGAHLALIAIIEGARRPAGGVLVYPMLDATRSQPSHETYAGGPGPSSEDIAHGYDLWLPPETDRRNPRVSPLFALLPKDLPPFYVLLAEHDPLRDEGLQCAARLHQAGAHVYASLFAGEIHGFLAYPGRFSHAQKAFTEIATFLSAL
jgi:acetyl esterase